MEAAERIHETQGNWLQGAFTILQAGVVLCTVASSSKRKELWVAAIALGLAGLAAFVWLLVRFWQRARVSVCDANRRWVVAGAVGAMADMLVHGSIDNSYFLVDLAFVFWLCLSLVDG